MPLIDTDKLTERLDRGLRTGLITQWDDIADAIEEEARAAAIMRTMAADPEHPHNMQIEQLLQACEVITENAADIIGKMSGQSVIDVHIKLIKDERPQLTVNKVIYP